MTCPMNYRKVGKYYHVWFSRIEEPPNGKLVSMKKIIGHPVTNERQAKQVIRELQKNWHKRKIIELGTRKNIKIADLADIFINDPDRTDLSEDTHRMDRLALKSLADVIGNIYLGSLIKADFKKFKQILLARNLSPNSINSYRRHILAALNWARDEHYLNRVPRFKPAKTGERLPKYLTIEQINELLTYTKKTDLEMWRKISFSLWTGARRSDFNGIDWRNVQGGICRVIGKGNKQRKLYLLEGALNAMGATKDIGPVFQKMHKDTISHRFKKIVDGCGIEATFHDLRRTCATFLRAKGVPLDMIQAVLGHADIRTTQIYVGIADELVLKEMEKLEY